MNRTAVRALRIGASIALLAAVIAVLPRGELTAAFRQASLRVLGLATLVFVLCHVAAACKWRLLMGRDTDVTVHLDATPLGRPVYERLGFRPQFDLQRWDGTCRAGA